MGTNGGGGGGSPPKKRGLSRSKIVWIVFAVLAIIFTIVYGLVSAVLLARYFDYPF